MAHHHSHSADTSDKTPLLRDASSSTGYDSTLHEVVNGCEVCQCCHEYPGGHKHISGLPRPAGFPTMPQMPHAPSMQKWIPDPEAVWNDPKHPEHKTRPRTLVLCFDGTGDQFDDDNSNVIQLLASLKKDDQRYQLIYYQAGIGTYTNSSVVTPVMSKVSKTLDEMFAWNLGTHVMQGYEFLMQNYTAGDKICIFGFSRGAYTARSLAGMIQKVGLLPSYNTQQIPFAWAMYNREDEDGWRSSEGFKKTFSIDVQIEFVGVWDTVASVGIIPRELPFVSSNSAITYFRHAIALDEHRAKFIPNFYHSSAKEQEICAKKQAECEASQAAGAQDPASGSSSVNGNGKHKHGRKMRRDMSDSELHQEAVNAKSGIVTDSKEVWFAGCHCDVGGGSVANHTRHSLARIPLRWMIRECFACNTGIIFDADILRDEMGINVDDLYPVYKPRDPTKRIKPSPGDSIAKTKDDSGFLLWDALKVIGSLIAIPIKIILNVVWFPIHHTWLLLKYSRAGHWIRKKLGLKGKGKGKKRSNGTNGRARSLSLLDEHNHESLGPNRKPFVSEEDEDYNDALSPEYDQLKLRWFWWIIELLPLRYRNQKGPRDDFFVRANFGQGRKIYGDARLKGIKVHHSVKTRLEVVDNKGEQVYKPRAFFNVGSKGDRERVDEWNVENPNPRTHWEWVY